MLYSTLNLFADGSQHHHVCSSDGRLVFPIHQLELLVERILNDINEFHLTFINEVSVPFFFYFLCNFFFNQFFFYVTLFYFIFLILTVFEDDGYGRHEII